MPNPMYRSRRRRSRARAPLVVATGLLLVAACGPSAPSVPPGGAELEFTQAGVGVRHNPEPGPRATWATDDAVLREAWSDPDLLSQTAPEDVTVPAGQVAVILDADHLHHGTEVVQVVAVDDGWLVRLQGYSTAACNLPAVVQAEVHLLLVKADEPPTTVEQEVDVLRGCGDG